MLFARALLACAAIAALGQTPSIRTNVPLTIIATSVTERSGQPVLGLTAADFTVLDNGVPRQVQVDTVEDMVAPVALVVVVETTGVAGAALAKIQKTGGVISQAVLGDNGEVALVTFDDEGHVVQPFTRDANTIAEAFHGLKLSGSGSGPMVDAIDKALDLLAARSGSQRAAILTISESKDRGGSKTKLSDVVAKFERSGTTLYSLTYSTYATPFTQKADEYQPPNGGMDAGIIGYVAELSRLARKNTVEALVRATGGTRLTFTTKAKLERDLLGVGRDIHSRYFLSFTPPQEDKPSFHNVQVKVRDRPELVVRARPGYWAGLATAQNGLSEP
jgi:VWFA-related protein